MLSFLSNSNIIIGQYEYTHKALNPEDISLLNIINNLKYLREIKSLAEKLYITKDINIEHMNINEIEYLKYIFTSIINETPIDYNNDLPYNCFFGNIDICGVILKIMCSSVEENRYIFKNFFDPNMQLEYSNKNYDNIRFKISPYLILKKEDFLECYNINYNDICNSIIRNEIFPDLNSQINQTVLEMIKAYDICKNLELLSCAKKLIVYLLEKGGYDNIYLVNYCQIIIRESSNLSECHIKKLIKIKKKLPNSSSDMLTAINILLGSYKEATISFNSMEENQQNIFKEYPIYHLWQNILN